MITTGSARHVQPGKGVRRVGVGRDKGGIVRGEDAGNVEDGVEMVSLYWGLPLSIEKAYIVFQVSTMGTP